MARDGRSRGRLRRAVLAALAPVLLCLSSCREESDRLKVYPVSGELFVDGQPAHEAFVYLHPLKPDPDHPMRPYGQVDKEGKFKISTYVSGDGAPAGEYTVTIEWLTYNPLGNQWGDPDKLEGKYSDAATSEIKVRVKEEATQLERITFTK